MAFSPRHLATLGMLLLAALLLGAAYFVFQAEIRQPLPGQGQAASDVPRILDEDVERTLLGDSDVIPDTYQPIAEENLFSPDRRPWNPPQAATSPPPPPPPAPRPPRVPTVRLYGTQVMDQERIGLFHIAELSGKNKHRMLREGESVWEGEGADGGFLFQVVSIERETASLVDSAGRSFDVGLYEHQRVASGRDGAQSAQRPTIVTSAPQRPREPLSESHSGPTDSGIEPGGSQQEGGPGASVPAEAEQGAPPPLIPIQNHEEMEQLVEEGKMRKIMTPFGPIYRPIPQQSP